MTKEQLAKLSAPFPDDLLSVKAQSYSKDRTKVMLVLYLDHPTVAARLDEVDPSWAFKLEPYIRETGSAGSVFVVTGSLTILGVTRMNIGEGNDPKSAASDCFKRCAMLFGVGRSLYDSDQVWVSYNEATDKFKQWSMNDYRAALKPSRPLSQPVVQPSRLPANGSKPPVPASVRAPVLPKPAPVKTQEDLNFDDVP